MKYRLSRILAGLLVLSAFFLVACGGSSSPSSPPAPGGSTSPVGVFVSDDPTDNWALIGVKVLGISLVPQGGGSTVSVYTAPATPPVTNLVQLDQISDLLATATIPTGNYVAARLTIAANPGDVSLVVAADPEPGFDVTNFPPGSTVPSAQIDIAGAQGTAPNMTIPLSVPFDETLSVTTSSTNLVDVEFDLRHPAFLVEHNPVSGTPFWVVNFNGPVHHHPHPRMDTLLLRKVYGRVNSVSNDNTSINITRVHPVRPVTNPETATPGSATFNVLADATNGTIFYDLDLGQKSTIMNFSSVAAALPNKYVRIAARYQQNGTLTATRIYAAAAFNTIWLNPEGHVLHVNYTNNTMWVTTEDGHAKHIAIDSNTEFLYQGGATPIGTGTAFFAPPATGHLPNFARGFKVSVTIDPLSAATPPVADTVDIEVARYNGVISAANSTGFNYRQGFRMGDPDAATCGDGYNGVIDYISSGSSNGTDPNNNPISGFYFWDFAFPTQIDSGANAITDYVNVTNNSVNFGGVVGILKTVGESTARWNDSAAANTWAANWTVLYPVPAPMGLISTPYSTSSNTFAYTVPVPMTSVRRTNVVSPALPVTVSLSTTSGSATLVYQVDRQGDNITVTPQDISNPTTLNTVAGQLVNGVPVKVSGIPTTSGTLKAYVLIYFTHTVSTM